jgi:hypothetical protein
MIMLHYLKAIIVSLLILGFPVWFYHESDAEGQDILFYIVLAVLVIQGNYQTYIIEKLKEQLKALEKSEE